jgi:hypothetical protein
MNELIVHEFGFEAVTTSDDDECSCNEVTNSFCEGFIHGVVS